MNDSEIDSTLRDLLSPYSPGYALEIGACDGVYLSNTLTLEKEGWKVLCIEPNPIYYDDLKESRAITLNYACSDKNEDDVPLMVYDRDGIPALGWAAGEPVSALGGLSHEFIKSFCPDVREPNSYPVKVRTLDHCLEEVGFPRLDFLSLDVDGIELKILRGFDIARWQTKVVLVENPFDNKEIIEYMEAAGFSDRQRFGVNDLWKKVA